MRPRENRCSSPVLIDRLRFPIKYFALRIDQSLLSVWGYRMNARDTSLDLMRFLGILIIMIAHAEPPDWLFQLRNFGTPLLVVASALTYATVYKNKTLIIIPFLRKRLSKLVFPAWVFLTVFFLFSYLMCQYTGKNYPFNLNKILSSYVFYDGIQFVWIFKIYIILALITPIAFYYKKNIYSDYKYFSLIVIAYIIYELMLYTISPLIPKHLYNFLISFIFIIFPYFLLFLYGLKLGELSNKQVITISISFFILFLSIAIYIKTFNGSFISTENFKYPPTIYYLSYAVFSLNIVYLLCRHWSNRINSKVIIWLSTNSLWIYLWHIFAFYLWKSAVGSTNGALLVSLFKAIYLLGFGILLTYLQILFVKKYLEQNQNPIFCRIATIFIMSSSTPQTERQRTP